MSKKQKTQMYASGGSVRSSKDSEYYKDTDSGGAVTLTRKDSGVARQAASSVKESEARAGRKFRDDSRETFEGHSRGAKAKTIGDVGRGRVRGASSGPAAATRAYRQFSRDKD